MREQYGFCNEVDLPRRSAEGEKRSLLYQFGKFRKVTPPPAESMKATIQRTAAKYPKTRVPSGFHTYKMGVTDKAIKEAFHQVTFKSGPGVPLAALATTKGEFVDKYLDLGVRAVRQRLHLLNSTQPIPKTARELIQHGYCDPCRVFEKNEPHPLGKLEEGRTRIITSLSLIDEVIERLLFGPQNNAEIDQWEDIPSKPGIGFSDEQNAVFWNHIKDFVAEAAESDISGYDFSVQFFMFVMDLHVRRLCNGASKDSAWWRIATNRIRCLTLSVFVTSDGEMFEQLVAGIMKSGSYITSSTNSRIRVMSSDLVGSEWAEAMGDDACEQWIENAIEKYHELGFRMKFYRRCSGNIEFCSHLYSDSGAYLLSHEKGLFNLLNSPPSLELLAQFLHEYRGSPHLPGMAMAISGSGWIPKLD